MDDLLDLNWSGDSNKNKPPSIPQKPSYLSGNPTSSNKKQDAFADLLNLPSSQKPTDRSQLPLAEQQRLMRQEAMGVQSPASFTSVSSSTKSSPRQHHQTAQDTFGSLLDPFGGKSSNAASSNANTPLNALRSQSSTPNQQTQAQWNFDLLDQSKTAASSPSLLDDPFDAASLPARSSAPPQPTINDNEEDDEDNPLGILSKPVQKPRTPSPEPEQQSFTSSPPRRSSPSNDMMVAQLMDMGFTDEQAKVALEATGGNDLQDAIDLLVQNAEAVTIQQRATSPMETSRSDTSRARQSVFRDDDSTPKKRPQQQQQQQQSSSDGSSATTPNFQQHKEKLVAQATELGGFLYKNASMFVKTGRERINKAVEDWQEQQRAEQRYRAEGRPKWMRDDINDEEEMAANRAREQYTEKFVDDDSSDEDPALERERELAWKKEQEAKRRAYVQQMRRQQQQERQRIERQQDEDVYVSPSRRRATPSRNSSRSQTPVSTTPMSPPKKQRTRPVVKASDDVMMRVNNARKMGNDKFKLGQFGEAEDAYTQAITMLPDGHDHLVILCNNRAATRLKIGEYKKCIEDCTLVVEMAESGGDDNIESEGVTIRWREQISKALHRKGEALEHMEKYKDAIKAYEHIVKLDGANNPKINQALARCRRAINPPPATSSSPAKPKSSSSNKKSDTAFPGVDYSVFEVDNSSSTPSSSTLSPADIDKSKAVAAMRAQAAKQEAEDAERMQKTDDVNARILQWKSGKENNLRALLATLDTLLWPGAQWRGANMSELINPKKCKIIYMKAIAKVHPDKLPSDVTVEQRMLASAIFSTLNEAWDSFKSQV